MRRFVVYSFFDTQGVVDRYVEDMLRDLKRNAEKVVVISNSQLDESNYARLAVIADAVKVRSNEGFDIAGYQQAMLEEGWDTLEQYDEIVVLNNTLMGPVYPLQEMFDAMAQREDLDFWGLTMHNGFPIDPFHCNPYGYIPPHVQSSFQVFRKRFVSEFVFRKYWEELPILATYEQAIGFHETRFTKYFEDQGFTWGVYIDTRDMEEITDYPLLTCPAKLIRDNRCPVFKRRSFNQNYDFYLHYGAGYPIAELYRYLRETGLYDVDKIWENVLRTMNQRDFYYSLNLNYTLSTRLSDREKAAGILKKSRVALVMHLYYMDLLPQSRAYALAIPPEADVYITTNTEEKKRQIEEFFADFPCHSLKVILLQNRGRDVGSLLIGFGPYVDQYDYVCFVHDKKSVQNKPASVGESFGNMCWDCNLKNRDYVYNILQLFDENPRLGMLSPPPPVFGPMFPLLHWKGWKPNWGVSNEVYRKLHFTVPIAEDKMPVSPYGTMFWFRAKALQPLYDYPWQYEDFPPEPNKTDGTVLHAMERLYSVAAQQAGYYPAVVATDEFAAVQRDNLLMYMTNLSGKLMRVVPGGESGRMAKDFREITPDILEARQTGNYAALHLTPAQRAMVPVVPPKNKWKSALGAFLRFVLPESAFYGLKRWKRRVFGPFI